jgi:hypothetical protein
MEPKVAAIDVAISANRILLGKSMWSSPLVEPEAALTTFSEWIITTRLTVAAMT